MLTHAHSCSLFLIHAQSSSLLLTLPHSCSLFLIHAHSSSLFLIHAQSSSLLLTLAHSSSFMLTLPHSCLLFLSHTMLCHEVAHAIPFVVIQSLNNVGMSSAIANCWGELFVGETLKRELLHIRTISLREPLNRRGFILIEAFFGVPAIFSKDCSHIVKILPLDLRNKD